MRELSQIDPELQTLVRERLDTREPRLPARFVPPPERPRRRGLTLAAVVVAFLLGLSVAVLINPATAGWVPSSLRQHLPGVSTPTPIPPPTAPPAAGPGGRPAGQPQPGATGSPSPSPDVAATPPASPGGGAGATPAAGATPTPQPGGITIQVSIPPLLPTPAPTPTPSPTPTCLLPLPLICIKT